MYIPLSAPCLTRTPKASSAKTHHVRLTTEAPKAKNELFTHYAYDALAAHQDILDVQNNCVTNEFYVVPLSRTFAIKERTA